MNKCVYVSFYTKNTPYENDVKTLEESLKKFELKYELFGIENQKSWERNCQQKSIIIKQALEKYPDNCIVYTDADSIICKEPELFEKINGDIGYCILPWRDNEVLSGTLFFRNIPKIHTFIDRWIYLNSTNLKWDQINLKEIIEHQSTDLSLIKYILPHAYCHIYDNKLQDVNIPVVEHYQASRRYKRLVSK